ncbi:MAG: mechanosensitive ion channel family protein [Burkholderiales bacterium]
MREWLQQNLGLRPELQARLLATLLVVATLWLLRHVALSLVYRRVTDPWARYRWRKATMYVTVITGILVVGRLWIAGLGSLATFLGLVSAGLAIALRDVVANLAGWVIIMWRRPFEVGNRIQIGVHKGDVIDLQLLQFTLLEIGGWVDADQSTGRLIHIPNGRVLAEPLANYNRGFPYIWHEVPVLVTFESDWKKAKTVLEAIATRHAERLTPEAERALVAASRQYLIYFKKLTPIVYTKVVEDGVRLTIRYLIDPRARRGSEQAIWQDVLDEFRAAPDIDLAYPTRRAIDYTREGKPTLRKTTRPSPD